MITLPPWPVYGEEEREAVERVLLSGKSNYWTGEEGNNFEKEFAAYIGVQHGACVFNGTVALELALRSCGIGRGDEVIVTSRSFLASASAVAAVGATPVFADVDFTSGNMTCNTISDVCTAKTKAILIVHIGGWPADMPSIMEFAASKQLKVIEDCAQAHGASIDGKKVGSFGDAAAFSFCQDKIISTGGEGGMVLTNDQNVFDLVWSFRDHGRDRESTLSNDHPKGFRWTQKRIGTNARMTEVQATIGRVQLRKLPLWLKERKSNAEALGEMMSSWDGIQVPVILGNLEHAYYRLTVLADSLERRNQYMDTLNNVGFSATIGPCPEIYREEAFVTLGFSPKQTLPVAAELGNRSLVLPTHPGVEGVLEQIANIK